jgi:hypothetical protein
MAFSCTYASSAAAPWAARHSVASSGGSYAAKPSHGPPNAMFVGEWLPLFSHVSRRMASKASTCCVSRTWLASLRRALSRELEVRRPRGRTLLGAGHGGGHPASSCAESGRTRVAGLRPQAGCP